VIGAVRNSTSVQYKEGAGIDYYNQSRRGFSKEADTKEAHLVKADGSAISSFTNVRTIEPGDVSWSRPRKRKRFAGWDSP